MGQDATTHSRIDAAAAASVQRREGDSHKVAGIVLAGVHAWGDCILEWVASRPLLPIAFRPLIWHILEWLEHGGVGQATVCANSDTARLRYALGMVGPAGLPIDYYEDVMPRGPAGCARDAGLNKPVDTLLVVEGTIFPSLDLEALLKAHRDSGAVLTIAAQHKDDRTDASDLEPVGVYVFSSEVLATVPEHGYQDIKETLIPRLYSQGQVIETFVVPPSSTPRVGGSGSYLGVNLWVVEQALATRDVPPGYRLVGDSWVHESSRVHSTARFVGPVWVGPDCEIESGAILVGPMSMGNGCHIESDAVISCSVLWDGCRVRRGAVLDHCVLTRGSDVAAEMVVRKAVCLPTCGRKSTDPAKTQFYDLEGQWAPGAGGGAKQSN